MEQLPDLEAIVEARDIIYEIIDSIGPNERAKLYEVLKLLGVDGDPDAPSDADRPGG